MDSEIVFAPDSTREGTRSFLKRWVKGVGDRVERSEVIAEIVTDKVNIEVATQTAGTITKIFILEGEEVLSGIPLAEISLSHMNVNMQPESGVTGEQPRGLSSEISITQNAKGVGSRRIIHSPIRKTIAYNMVQSVTKAPHVTALFECGMLSVLNHKKLAKERGIRISLTSYIVKGVATAVQEVPEINSRWHDDYIEVFDHCNVGIGVNLPEGGVVVPVIHKANLLSIEEIALKLDDLVNRARNGALSREDMEGGSITISNHGVSGSMFATPIIITGSQAAIIGVGAVEKRAVVINNKIGIRPICYLSITIDHRVLDGTLANRAMVRLKKYLEVDIA